jgi:hypothetical protein
LRGRGVELRPDRREFRSVRWYNSDEQPEWPDDQFDPQMDRFIRKLKAAAARPLACASPHAISYWLVTEFLVVA